MPDSLAKQQTQQPMTYRGAQVPCRRVLELHLNSTQSLADPVHDAHLIASFVEPSGQQHLWNGFWDGAERWLVRFSPRAEGNWRYSLRLLDKHGQTITSQEGNFTATSALNETPFDRHGPIQLSPDKRNLIHADGTPFLWLADTAWNVPLRSTEEEWEKYLSVRVQQRFSAVQWVATQWRSSPQGDIEGQPTFTTDDPIAINPSFFQRLDKKVERLTESGLLSVPVMLWAVGHGANPNIDPGFWLSESEAIHLARYQVARWAAYPTVWILAGDGSYFGEFAARWRRIGRATFGDQPHSPVAMHCGGEQWPADELRNEEWMGILGYQSGHGDSTKTLNWIVKGPPATDWGKEPRLFQLNFEPAYENHLAYHSRQPHTPHSVRIAMYWSLFNAPTAGVSYGGHGVWGWDDGTTAPADHPNTGVPMPWPQALHMPAAQQVAYMADFLTSLNWWELTPAQHLLLQQPGDDEVSHTILVSSAASGNLIVAYTPAGQNVILNATTLSSDATGIWCNPRTGERTTAKMSVSNGAATFAAPDQEDWLLIIQSAT